MTSVPAASIREPLVDDRATRHPASWWGMVWLCATEGMLFACLIASYFFLRGAAEAFLEGGGKYPSLGVPLVMTGVLLSSSVSLWWAERGIRQGKLGQLRTGLLVTFALGVLFLVLQGTEYAARPFGPATSANESIFYATTGLHGAHVAFGLLMNLFVQGLVWRGRIDSQRYVAVRNFALYWHFVDAVWVTILLALYISPRLW
ncbi:MAG: cytochrome c oxidase subunit 3 [Gemmatimonadota bacterium]